jgi:hypothetical protein
MPGTGPRSIKEKKMKINKKIPKISLAFIIILLIFPGCSSGNPANNSKPENPESIDKGGLREPTTSSTIIFTDTPDSPRIFTTSAKSIRSNILYSFLGPMTMYKMANGSWPQSWNDLKNGYLPFIPGDPNTGVEFKFFTLNEIGGAAPANSIVADWAADGCTIYTGKPGKDAWMCISLNRALIQKAIDVCESEPGKGGIKGAGFDDPAYRLALIIRTWMDLVLSSHYELNHVLPGSQAELMSGFKINHDFNPGYVVDTETGAGKFTIATYPEENKYYFQCIFGNPRQVVMYAFHIAGEHFMDRQPMDISKEPIDKYKVLLTESVFFH